MKKIILILILLLSGCATLPYELKHHNSCINYILKEYNPSFNYSLWDRQRFFQEKIDCWTYRTMPIYLQNMYEKE